MVQPKSTIWLICLALIATAPAAAKPKKVPANQVKGQPEIEAGKQTGFFIWYDTDGFHLRWTTEGKPVLFSGRVDLDKPMAEFKRVFEQGGGWVEKHGDRILMFSATSRGELDGFDLKVSSGRRLQLELKVDGKEPALEQVFLGKTGTHPKGLPLLILYR